MSRTSGKKALFKALPVGEGKTDFLPRVRVSTVEKALIQQRADDCGVSLSDYLRNQALGKGTRTRIEARLISDLAMFSNLLRELRNAGTRETDGAYLAAMQAAVDAIASFGIGEGRGGISENEAEGTQ